MGSPFDKLSGMKKTSSNEAVQIKKEKSNFITETKVKITPNKITRTTSNLKRIPSGVRGFDQMTNGGFLPESINLISGGPGTGKTIFALQFILDGIFMYNEPGIFISFDEKKENVYSNMKAIGWDLEKLEKEEKFYFIEYSPEQLIKILDEGGGLLDNLMGKINAGRIVVDTISTFLLVSSSEFGKRELLRSFFKLLKKWKVTTLLTNEFSPMTGTEINQETKAIFYEVDSMTQLHYVYDKIGAERQRLLEVYKMRGTKHVTKAIPYKISQNGIQIIL